LEEIQDEFGEFYPHLKILFYPKDQQSESSFFSEIDEIKKNKIKVYRVKNNSGFLYLHDDLTVSKLKENLYLYFGLRAEFFQKIAPNSWSKKPVKNERLLSEISFEIN
jgi:hypothetical protein